MKHQKKSNDSNDCGLLIRKRFHEFAKPKIDPENEVINYMNLTKVESILDMGCGVGDLLIKLRKDKNFIGNLSGVDISEEIIEMGIQKSEEENLNINFQIEDIESKEIGVKQYDVITAKHVLYYMKDLERAINRINLSIKNEGQFILSLNSKYNKPKLHEFRGLISNEYHLENTIQNKAPLKKNPGPLFIESIDEYLMEFSDVQTKIYESSVELDTPEPFVEYFMTFYHKKLGDDLLRSIKNSVEKLVQREIDKYSVFVEKNVLGIAVAKK